MLIVEEQLMAFRAHDMYFRAVSSLQSIAISTKEICPPPSLSTHII